MLQLDVWRWFVLKLLHPTCAGAACNWPAPQKAKASGPSKPLWPAPCSTLVWGIFVRPVPTESKNGSNQPRLNAKCLSSKMTRPRLRHPPLEFGAWQSPQTAPFLVARHGPGCFMWWNTFEHQSRTNQVLLDSKSILYNCKYSGVRWDEMISMLLEIQVAWRIVCASKKAFNSLAVKPNYQSFGRLWTSFSAWTLIHGLIESEKTSPVLSIAWASASPVLDHHSGDISTLWWARGPWWTLAATMRNGAGHNLIYLKNYPLDWSRKVPGKDKPRRYPQEREQYVGG